MNALEQQGLFLLFGGSMAHFVCGALSEAQHPRDAIFQSFPSFFMTSRAAWFACAAAS